jgi:hypothetical protein
MGRHSRNEGFERNGDVTPRAVPFACPDVDPGVITMASATIVQGSTRTEDIVIVFKCCTPYPIRIHRTKSLS